jgi:cystathionine beta-lyase
MPKAISSSTARSAFNAGSEFGEAYGNFVRVNFGCPRALLEEGLSRMERALGRNT